MITRKEMDRHDKNEKQINIFKNPKYRQSKAIDKLKEALTDDMKPMLIYGALEKSILVLYFSHSVIIPKFNNDKEDIKAKMRIIYKKYNMKNIIIFVDIRAKVINRPLPRSPKPPAFIERATGNFEIKADDDEISNKFKSIQNNIKECNNV